MMLSLSFSHFLPPYLIMLTLLEIRTRTRPVLLSILVVLLYNECGKRSETWWVEKGLRRLNLGVTLLSMVKMTLLIGHIGGVISATVILFVAFWSWR
jgi:ABC-type Fe3+ transport system permease subunit